MQNKYKSEVTRIVRENPNCIPIRCMRADDCNPVYPLLEKKKFAAPKDMTLSRFNEHIRQVVPIEGKSRPGHCQPASGSVLLLWLQVTGGVAWWQLAIVWWQLARRAKFIGVVGRCQVASVPRSFHHSNKDTKNVLLGEWNLMSSGHPRSPVVPPPPPCGSA